MIRDPMEGRKEEGRKDWEIIMEYEGVLISVPRLFFINIRSAVVF